MEEAPNVSLGPRYTLTHVNMQTHIHVHHTLMQDSISCLQPFFRPAIK